MKSYLGIIVHLRLTVPRQMVLLRERCTELRQELLLYCCNQAYTKSSGRIPWNDTAICETFKTSYRKGKHLVKGDLEKHSELSIILFLPKTSQDSIKMERKFLPCFFLGYALYACRKFLEPITEPKVIFCQCRGVWESLYVNASPFPDKWYC